MGFLVYIGAAGYAAIEEDKARLTKTWMQFEGSDEQGRLWSKYWI